MREPGFDPPKLQEGRVRPRRQRRGGPAVEEISVALEVVTPILGGAARTREIDEVDVIRVPTIRGHLRFWWRALYGHTFDNPRALYEAESALWGRAAEEGGGGRSAVEVRVEVKSEGEIDDSDIRPYPHQGQPATPGAYALWPARHQGGQADADYEPPAPRRLPGTTFRLTVVAGEENPAVRAAVRAWILFGGYGSRTRRGVGSLTVTENGDAWLPAAANAEEIRRVLALGGNGRARCDLPCLLGAMMHVGKPNDSAERAWTTALGWLNAFRQGTAGPQGQRAREPGPRNDRNRPSISNWPEADKVRQLSGPPGGWSHSPRHNKTLVWPRAGFGLPIIGQFQRKGRAQGQRYQEPRDFELRWRRGDDEFDRLASPLIVKALPLADGSYAPCALWLWRGYPRNGRVALKPGDPRSRDSAAEFDLLVADGDTALFEPLGVGQAAEAGVRLRTAFFTWLAQHHQTTEVVL